MCRHLSVVDVDMRNYTTDPYTSNTLNSFTKSGMFTFSHVIPQIPIPYILVRLSGIRKNYGDETEHRRFITLALLLFQ